jgi:hypothetical protein
MQEYEILKLRNRIIQDLEEQGFLINPHLRPREYNKLTLKKVQEKSRFEQISHHINFIRENLHITKKYCRNGNEIIPKDLKLELREVKAKTFEEIIFKWWNFVWWSIPYQHAYGRQMRFLLWDITHDAPFGLFYLQSPVLKMSVRDISLGIPKNELDIWINRSLNAQRVGAIPPYNDLIGGKLVAITLTTNEVREKYRLKYSDTLSILKERKLNSDLLFITTTSAYGKSSMYNRLKYNGENVAECLGFTKGSGSFHIPEKLYKEILKLLSDNGVNTERCFGHGPSRKLRLISKGFKNLGLSNFQYHDIKRAFYLFPLVKNLKEIIQTKVEPLWIDRKFNDIVDYWKERWALPRIERKPEWTNFSRDEYFSQVRKIIEDI